MRIDAARVLSEGIKLLAVCLLVGMVLAFLGLDDPWSVWSRVVGGLKGVFSDLGGWLDWAWGHVLIGAGIVIPVYLILLALRLTRRTPR